MQSTNHEEVKVNTTTIEREVTTTTSQSVGAKKPPKMIPDIGLATFVTFDAKSTGSGVYPEPFKVTPKAGGRSVVTLGNIPLPAGVPAPKNAMTLLYGFRDALDEMKGQYAKARKENRELVKIEFKLQVGTDAPNTGIVMGTASLEDIPKCRFLNILRLNQDLQQLLLDEINEALVVEAQKAKKAAIYFDKIVEAGARPDLMCDAIRKHPAFKHVNSVVYSVPDGTPRGRKVCSIFETDSIIDMNIRGSAPFDIEIPKL